MGIEGLIDQGNSLSSDPFNLPSASADGAGRTSTSSTDRDLRNLFSFGFPNSPPTPSIHPDFTDSTHTRKRSSNDLDGIGSIPPRPSPPGRKKSQPKGETSRMSVSKDYPRRRALQACQICRARKTKCDNERPNCGNCVVLGVDCNYNEAPAAKSFYAMFS
jgi:hypothetical protein